MLPVVHEEWLMGLNHFTTDEIANGLNNWHEDWPPNLQQFKRACKQPPVGRPAACYDDYQDKALPAPKNKRIAEQELQKMREILK